MERVKRVNDLIQEELGKIILKEMDFPQGSLVTITRVETAANFQTTKIFVSCLPDGFADKVMRILKRNIYDIQQMLNKVLRMRPIPKIIFYQEDKTIEAAKIETILARERNSPLS